jgi:hypothetical protein
MTFRGKTKLHEPVDTIAILADENHAVGTSYNITVLI